MRMHDRRSLATRVRGERRAVEPVVRAARVWVARPSRAAVPAVAVGRGGPNVVSWARRHA